MIDIFKDKHIDINDLKVVTKLKKCPVDANGNLALYSAGAYLVLVRFKYSSETSWDLSLEPYFSDGFGFNEWTYDWYEGQQDVQYIGYIDIEDIEIKGEFK